MMQRVKSNANAKHLNSFQETKAEAAIRGYQEDFSS